MMVVVVLIAIAWAVVIGLGWVARRTFGRERLAVALRVARPIFFVMMLGFTVWAATRP